MSTAFQYDAYQQDAYQIDLTTEEAFQRCAFQFEAFQTLDCGVIPPTEESENYIMRARRLGRR